MTVDHDNVPRNVGRRLSTHKYHKMVGDPPEYKVRPVIACNGVAESELSENFAAACNLINDSEDLHWLRLWEKVPGAGLVFPWRLKGIEELQMRIRTWNKVEQEFLRKVVVFLNGFIYNKNIL